ncbi:hypothetical protein [Gordonia alkanivorans]|uniref:hypothetical protein n=1 Tax=Gordonia alkanivorans TaxID=84096 RepID=UPI0024B738A3|nr:hypothetical protein [Gordonia alkanivorans]MDJ0010152.1 hypothetical protein [Gordonia alkanivorans]MDJ0495658.1 hypothetical protein [Gordonia alkanivorans]
MPEFKVGDRVRWIGTDVAGRIVGFAGVDPQHGSITRSAENTTSWADVEITHNNPLPHVDTNSLTLVELLEHID